MNVTATLYPSWPGSDEAPVPGAYTGVGKDMPTALNAAWANVPASMKGPGCICSVKFTVAP